MKTRICKRCKTNEAEKGSLNCEKCNKRNSEVTLKKMLASNAEIIKKSECAAAYGGLGSELESGNMNYEAYYI